ncbi:MAG: 3-deoxy-7-phosphoheptulonate synthase [Dehalococcoidia bacterium]|nr:3-deoxy-7-phosphoheptulonate synthase [Dehalococcoidia bacterium]
MIVEMRKGATEADIDQVVATARGLAFDVQMNYGSEKTVVAILGSETGRTATDTFALLPGVLSVQRIMKPYKLASREFRPQSTVANVAGIEIGGTRLVVMAGPCAVESEEQVFQTAQAVKKAGARILRGGAYKPRTSPFSFQGLQEEGLKILSRVRDALDLPIITEVMDTHEVELVARHADILQVGARNMQNYSLLREVGKTGRPVVLKRGFSCTVNEWLTAADYVLAEGNENVILCERGIRTFEDSTRFSLDISSLPVVHKFSHLPIIVDPSHPAGHFEYVPALAKAGLAAGADGLLIEVHPNPSQALVDGLQSLTFERFERLMAELSTLAQALGRSL